MQGFATLTKSIAFPQTAADQTFVARRQDVVPQFGPRNRPIVIDRIVVTCEATLTVAGTAIDGEDVWRAMRGVTLMQVDKVPRINNVNGDQLRIAMIDKAGAECVKEHIDLPIGGPTAYTFSFPLELGSRKSYDEDDLAMPGELFDFLQWTGFPSGASTAGPQVAGGTLTLGTITWRVTTEFREVPYSVLCPFDIIESVPFGAAPDLNKIVGGRIHALYLHRRAAVGGATLPNITEVSVDELGRIGLSPSVDLIEWYARERGMVTGSNAASPGVQLRNDPVLAGRAIPIVFASKRSKVTGGVDLTTVQIRTLQSSPYTDVTAILRVVRPPNMDNQAVLDQAHGARGGWKLKTRDKTALDPSKWGDGTDGRYLPVKRMLPQFIGR